MPFYTPLRYPGGKRRLASFVMRLLEENQLRDVQYVEPCAGGASIALALLFQEYAASIHINDLSRPVYAFWHSVLNDTGQLCDRIESTQVTMEEWHRQRAVYDQQESADLGELGFAAFFLNRTNRSGILTGGVIGGKGQTGKWSLDARFTKLELIQRIRRIARYKHRIRLYHMDALDFTNGVMPELGMNTFAFYDPPYIEKGKALYLDTYDLDDHKRLATRIVQLDQPWVITYDYEAAVRYQLYPSYPRLVFHLSYSAQSRHGGKEAMFLSERLKIPPTWRAEEPVEISAPQGRHPVYGRMEAMATHPEMEEGATARERFVKALKTVITVPKANVPNPFKKTAAKRKPANRDG